jgi:hypothetical protein
MTAIPSNPDFPISEAALDMIATAIQESGESSVFIPRDVSAVLFVARVRDVVASMLGIDVAEIVPLRLDDDVWTCGLRIVRTTDTTDGVAR